MICNTENDLIYIGQTVRSIKKRWNEHCNPNNECRAIGDAIQAIGKDKFSISAIASARGRANASFIEDRLIKQYNTIEPNGYNLHTFTGGVSVSTRQKISKSLTNKKASPETRAKQRAAWTPEKRALASADHKPKNGDTSKFKEMAQISSEKTRGVPRSQEVKDKISIAKKGIVFTQEHKQKLSLSRKGKPLSPKQREAATNNGNRLRGIKRDPTIIEKGASKRRKFNIEIATHIRNEYNNGTSVKDLMIIYDIGQGTIYRILNNDVYVDASYVPNMRASCFAPRNSK